MHGGLERSGGSLQGKMDHRKGRGHQEGPSRDKGQLGPRPQLRPAEHDHHGTRCMGEAAAEPARSAGWASRTRRG